MLTDGARLRQCVLCHKNATYKYISLSVMVYSITDVGKLLLLFARVLWLEICIYQTDSDGSE